MVKTNGNAIAVKIPKTPLERNAAEVRRVNSNVAIPERVVEAEEHEVEIHDYCRSKLPPGKRRQGCCLFHNRQRAICRAYVERRLPSIEGAIRRLIYEQDWSIAHTEYAVTILCAMADAALCSQWQYPEKWIVENPSPESDQREQRFPSLAEQYDRATQPDAWKDEIRALTGVKVNGSPEDLWSDLCKLRYYVDAYTSAMRAGGA